MANPLVVLHRVQFADSQMSLLPHDSIVKAGSVGQVERALAKAERVVVVVDLSIGGGQPGSDGQKTVGGSFTVIGKPYLVPER